MPKAGRAECRGDSSAGFLEYLSLKDAHQTAINVGDKDARADTAQPKCQKGLLGPAPTKLLSRFCARRFEVDVILGQVREPLVGLALFFESQLK